jgi:O-Antigen ligase/Tetratricopeptide repeat
VTTAREASTTAVDGERDPGRHAALPALLVGIPAVALMLVWAAHDGGYDADTWYWGALLLLAALGAVLGGGLGRRRRRTSRPTRIALGAFALYVAWSYLSISWAASPGDAFQGSNRALLYLIVFALMAVLPWGAKGVLAALLIYVVGVGVIAIVVLVRLASGAHVDQLVLDGRLIFPTGYFNSTVALFTIDGLAAIVLAARRELPALLRGGLVAIACAALQLAVIGQSRGWLFTLPLVAVVGVAMVRDRFRVVATAIPPIVAAAVPVHKLIAVFNSTGHMALVAAAKAAGRESLVLCAVMAAVATLVAVMETFRPPPALSPGRRRRFGVALAVLAVTVACVGAVAATHGDPFGFISRQWRGFSTPTNTAVSGSHFATVGSGRYDFWRVSLDAFVKHPIGGLGQDNFADYYILHRRTSEDPVSTHSLEMRLLAQTGVVGFALFAVFLGAAIAAALQARRRGSELGRALAGAAMLPLAVWLIHGSVDWFWEMPALSGPALGFLAMAGALGRPAATVPDPGARWSWMRPLQLAAGSLAMLLAALALGLSYLSVREVSVASDLRASNPGRALDDLSTAANLNPLSADPGRLGGTIALQTGRYLEAEQRFEQAISREPGAWYAWLGRGLAASALGDVSAARHDFKVAASINSQQPVIRSALARVHSARPLSPAAALTMLVETQAT